MANYDKGDLIRCSAAFTISSTGAAIDPTKVYFKVEDPSGNVTKYEYGKDDQLKKETGSTGNYYVDVDGDESGTWHYRFWGIGMGQAAAEGSFMVSASEF